MVRNMEDQATIWNSKKMHIEGCRLDKYYTQEAAALLDLRATFVPPMSPTMCILCCPSLNMTEYDKIALCLQIPVHPENNIIIYYNNIIYI